MWVLQAAMGITSCQHKWHVTGQCHGFERAGFNILGTRSAGPIVQTGMLVASHEGGQLIMQDSSLIMTIYITGGQNDEELRDEENKVDIVWKMLFVAQRDKERQSKKPFQYRRR